MNAPFDPNTFTFLLKSQITCTELYARHFTILLVAFRNWIMLVCLSDFYLLVSTPMYSDIIPPSHRVRPWNLQQGKLGPSSSYAIAACVTLGKMLKLSFYSSDVT